MFKFHNIVIFFTIIGTTKNGTGVDVVPQHRLKPSTVFSFINVKIF